MALPITTIWAAGLVSKPPAIDRPGAGERSAYADLTVHGANGGLGGVFRSS